MKLIKYLFTILLITPAACSDSNDQAIDEDLLNVVWRVDTLQTPEEEIVPGPDTLMTIQFNRSLKVSGRGGCNSYNGIYEISKKNSLSVDVLTWTEMGCDGGRLLDLDGFLINALENVTAYNVSENRLTLYDSDHQHVLNFSIE